MRQEVFREGITVEFIPLAEADRAQHLLPSNHAAKAVFYRRLRAFLIP